MSFLKFFWSKVRGLAVFEIAVLILRAGFPRKMHFQQWKRSNEIEFFIM